MSRVHGRPKKTLLEFGRMITEQHTIMWRIEVTVRVWSARLGMSARRSEVRNNICFFGGYISQLLMRSMREEPDPLNIIKRSLFGICFLVCAYLIYLAAFHMRLSL